MKSGILELQPERMCPSIFLDKARSTTKVIIFMRHAAKDAFGGLSQQGREKAVEFGARLPAGFSLRLSHSSVKRCEETAEHIQTGFKYKDSKILGVDRKLETLYYFCNDPEKMKTCKQQLGGTMFLHNWINGTLPIGMMCPAKEVVTKMADHFLSELQSSADYTIQLFIGHDFGIVLVRDILFGTDFQKGNVPWILPLDGIVFSENGGQLTASWHGQFIRHF